MEDSTKLLVYMFWLLLIVMNCATVYMCFGMVRNNIRTEGYFMAFFAAFTLSLCLYFGWKLFFVWKIF